jgi:hypothetical protein
MEKINKQNPKESIPVPKCRNFRAKEPRINEDLQEENGHLEGGISEKTNTLFYSTVCNTFRKRQKKSILEKFKELTIQ